MSFPEPFDKIIHSEGVVFPAVLKGGRRVFVITGNVRLTFDGGIDLEESDKVLTAYDAETFSIKKIQIDGILKVLEPISEKKAEEIINCQFVVGRKYDMLDDGGSRYRVKIIEVRDVDTLLLLADGEDSPSEMPQWLAKQWVDNANSNQEPTTEDIVNALFTESEKVSPKVFNQLKSNAETVKTPKNDGDGWKSWLENYGCFVLVLLFVLGFISTCTYNSINDGRKERQRKEFVSDSIAKREQFVKDSIDSVHKSPEYIAYQDSLRLAQIKKHEDEQKATIVLVCVRDSVYHFMTECFSVPEISRIRLMSEYDAQKIGLKECYHCVRNFDGYIAVEDIGEYVSLNFSKSEIIEMFDITGEDFEDPYEREYINSAD